MTHTMKSLVLTLSVAALSAVSALAETRVAVVHVPFAFTAGSNEMPAGDYSISKTEQGVLFLRTDAKTVAVLPIGSTAPSFGGKSSAVRFEKLDGRTILTEVVVDGGEGYLLRK